MNLGLPFAKASVIASVLLFSACESDSNGGPPLQPVADLPVQFMDNHGGTWLCDQPQYDSQITGTVALNNPPLPLQNTDILHLALFEQQEDDQLRSIASYCINNINGLPVPFTLTYDPAQIDGSLRYGISANYFVLTADGSYEASHKRDGSNPVINNGVTSQVDIVLPSAN